MAFSLDESVIRQQRGAKRYAGNWRLSCPIHGGSQSLALNNGHRGAVWHCHAGCDAVSVRNALLAAGMLVETREPGKAKRMDRDKKRAKEKRAWMNRQWQAGRPLEYSDAKWWSRRGIARSTAVEAGRGGQVLRAVSRDKDWMLLAKVQDRESKPVALQQTLVPWQEREPHRRRFHGPVSGAAVRLFGDEAESGRLWLAEGIESALAYRTLHLAPGDLIWCVLSAVGIKNFQPPAWVREITVAVDFDGSSIKAAEELAVRMRKAEVPVSLAIPGGEAFYKKDWNDLMPATGSPRSPESSTMP